MAKPIVIGDSGKLRVELDPGVDTLVIRPVGALDEDVNFGKIFQEAGVLGPGIRKIDFDLGHVTRVNSCGTREWVIFLQRVQAKYECRFVRISETFIDAASVVPSMLGRAGTPVLSFDAPYLCPKCGQRFIKRVTAADVRIEDGQYASPVCDCEKCGGPLEFDALDTEYFNFLKHAAPRRG